MRYLLLIFILGLAGGVYLLRFDPRPVFVEGVVGQPVNLDPSVGQNNGIDEVLEALLFRALFNYDRSGELSLDLAESYQVEEDGKVYVIRLKENLFWHDGRPITAKDVVYTFVQDPGFVGVGVEAAEEGVVRFELKDPLASFLSILTRPIVPVHLPNQSEFPAVGSGDFRIRHVARNGFITEVALQNLDREGVIRELIFKFFRSQAELEKAVRRGEVDAFVGDRFDHFSFTKYEAPLYGQYFAIFFNLNSGNSLVKDSPFRKAAVEKTPVVDLINDILGGGGSPVRGPFSGTWAEADLPFPTFSPTLKGGYEGKILLTVPEVGSLPEVAEVIAENWQELGVEVDIKRIDPSEIRGLVESKDFEAVLLGQEVDRDPDRYSLWHSTQKTYPGLNITSYVDPRADRSLEDGRKETDRAERKEHYRHFQQLFAEDNPAVFLYHPNLNYFVSRKFSGIDLSPVFVPTDRFWNIREWKKL